MFPLRGADTRDGRAPPLRGAGDDMRELPRGTARFDDGADIPDRDGPPIDGRDGVAIDGRDGADGIAPRGTARYAGRCGALEGADMRGCDGIESIRGADGIAPRGTARYAGRCGVLEGADMRGCCDVIESIRGVDGIAPRGTARYAGRSCALDGAVMRGRASVRGDADIPARGTRMVPASTARVARGRLVSAFRRTPAGSRGGRAAAGKLRSGTAGWAPRVK